MSNAVNFTDGLDGLAGLISATIFAAYGGIALMQGQVFIGPVLFHHGRSLVRLSCGSTSTRPSCSWAIPAPFRWAQPSRVIALMTGQWALLPVIAVIPVSEALSDVIQIVYFKMTHGRRFFKMAPIHLHFELLGWSETQIVQRFWLIGLIGSHARHWIGTGVATMRTNGLERKTCDHSRRRPPGTGSRALAGAPRRSRDRE